MIQLNPVCSILCRQAEDVWTVLVAYLLLGMGSLISHVFVRH